MTVSGEQLDLGSLTLYSAVLTLCTTRFNITKILQSLPQFIYVFWKDLRTNMHYVHVQR